MAAQEAFVTSASQIVLPVVTIDGRPGGYRRAWTCRRGITARISPLRGILLTFQRDVNAPGIAELGLALHRNVPSNERAHVAPGGQT
jgi:hypothetical protein